MTRDKKVLYILSSVAFAALLACFFLKFGDGKLLTAAVLLVLTVTSSLLIKKRGSLSINKREVLLLSAVIAVLYVILIQILGIYFRYYKNPYFVTKSIFLRNILPTVAIIVCSEILRRVLLAQNNRYADVMSYLTCVIAEVLSFSNIVGITNFNRFMDLVGLTLFPALSANVYYHYVSKRFGMSPNIVFRLITALYVYFVPTTIGMSNAMHACIKIFLPLVMLAFMSALYEKNKKKAVHRSKKLSVVGMILAVAFIISVTMLISCQFRFGALVVATESMTGEVNKGDMIIYERYDDQTIKEGQIIVFQESQSKIIHRVVRIENINGEVRYYTKGDANAEIDGGYRLDGDIVGLTDIKISYIGYPTLWLRQLLPSS